MKRIAVSGANKGIGLAIVRALLAHDSSIHVLLGSRSVESGIAAVSALEADGPGNAGRVSLLHLDVTDDASVTAAAASVASTGALWGFVCNAGVAPSSTVSAAAVMDTNLFGVRRCVEAFAPLLPPDGRIAVVSSGSGPMFAAKVSPTRAAWLTQPHPWEHISTAAQEFLAVLAAAGTDGGAALEAGGWGSDKSPMACYGCSKALLNTYVKSVASSTRTFIAGASPGFISTALTAGFFTDKKPEDAGALPVEESVHSTMHILFSAKREHSGWYFGSDCKRSPLTKYRSPGSPEYEGEE